MLKDILLVAFGGAAGSVSRYLLSKAVQGVVSSAFPLGTLAVNAAGCLIMGVVCGLSKGGGAPLSSDAKLLLAVGFCGGFTTFSAFMDESLALIKGGDVLSCVLYVCASMALGALGLLSGFYLAK
ncbi:MAG: fluoride efflux transporter CrcB [Verrucomicrobia bacterium]|nr:MAG: fluoride efflux transporter CrcB [Verrucomicrobiota bacterium]